MRVSKIIILSFIISSLFQTTKLYAAKSNHWKLKNTIGHSKIWIFSESRKVILTRTEMDFKYPEVKGFLKSKKFIKNMNKQKASFLKFAGISKWKMKSYLWKKNDLLEVQGSYIDKDFKKVAFKEYHKFKKSRVVRLLFTKPFNDKFEIDKHEKFIYKQLNIK